MPLVSASCCKKSSHLNLKTETRKRLDCDVDAGEDGRAVCGDEVTERRGERQTFQEQSCFFLKPIITMIYNYKTQLYRECKCVTST